MQKAIAGLDNLETASKKADCYRGIMLETEPKGKKELDGSELDSHKWAVEAQVPFS